MKKLLMILCWAGSVSIALGAVRRVPSEYITIQNAIDACVDGDVVLVAPGTYSGDGSTRVTINNSAIQLVSECGPVETILDCSETGGGIRLSNDNDYNNKERMLKGFTIKSGYSSSAVSCGARANITISDCIVKESKIGIVVTGVDSNVNIANCLITSNRSHGNRSLGGGISLDRCFRTVVFVKNSVIVGNQAAYGGGVACEVGSISLENCIVRDNRASTSRGNQLYIGNRGVGCPIMGCTEGAIDLIHCCFDQEIPFLYLDYEGGWGNINKKHMIDFYGQGNIAADPCFVDSGYWYGVIETPNDPNDDIYVSGDYHLQSQAGRWDSNNESWIQDEVTSPCIDAGDPNSLIMYESFPNGGVINMGAYGGTVEASKSYFGEPVSETIIAGDINGDGRVNFEDLMILIRNWSD